MCYKFVCNVSFDPADCFSKYHTPDALAALLLLMREAELNEQWYLYIETKWETNKLLARLATFEPFGYIAKGLNDIIHARFMQRNEPPPEYLKTEESDEYPSCYKGPPGKFDVLKAVQVNSDTLTRAMICSPVFQSGELGPLDYLYEAQLYHGRDPPNDHEIVVFY